MALQPSRAGFQRRCANHQMINFSHDFSPKGPTRRKSLGT
jgi:hypothetical protein